MSEYYRVLTTLPKWNDNHYSMIVDASRGILFDIQMEYALRNEHDTKLCR
jgi:hypothetical protein